MENGREEVSLGHDCDGKHVKYKGNHDPEKKLRKSVYCYPKQ